MSGKLSFLMTTQRMVLTSDWLNRKWPTPSGWSTNQTWQRGSSAYRLFSSYRRCDHHPRCWMVIRSEQLPQPVTTKSFMGRLTWCLAHASSVVGHTGSVLLALRLQPSTDGLIKYVHQPESDRCSHIQTRYLHSNHAFIVAFTPGLRIEYRRRWTKAKVVTIISLTNTIEKGDRQVLISIIDSIIKYENRILGQVKTQSMVFYNLGNDSISPIKP